MVEHVSQDPVFFRDGHWYHYDEVWCDEFGPFSSREVAESHLRSYCAWLDTGELPPELGVVVDTVDV